MKPAFNPRLSFLFRQRTSLYWRYGLWLLFASTLTLLVVLGQQAAQAYQVAINPGDPELGTTFSVVVQAEDPASTEPPTITLDDQQEFASFPLGNNRYRALIPTSPLDRSGEHIVRVIGQEPTRNLTVWLRNRSFPTQRIWLPADRAGIEGTDYEFDRVGTFKQTVSPEKYWNGPLQRPSSGRVSTPYGVRRYYNGVFAEDYYHRGVDYAAPTGTPVVAPAAGQVRLVGRVADGFELHGNTIGIDHGQGVLSIFIHLSRIDVQEGDFVQAGQPVGAIGSTGASTGPHLHWGLYVNGVAVDPTQWRDQSID
ncbi:MAG: M23 family metallopeptidase [Leptolyngbya sp. SIO4C5]|uniref:M23 family metallopeptidase n=1 Tax=Sphaerothrix gracilis TaxID=3151835 RepID=UPI0013C1D5FF|nr:M23 family metallopeptidase [Leptolyngbya sp. SIO4C5]